jgi:hypothetical protein
MSEVSEFTAQISQVHSLSKQEDQVTLKMNPEVKNLWIQDLRSGTILHAVGALKTKYLDGTECFCVLGRLTELYRISDANVTGLDWEDVSHNTALKRFDGSQAMLCERVKNWAGLPSLTGGLIKVPEELKVSYKIDGNYHVLSYLNDRGIPLEILADLIEAQL